MCPVDLQAHFASEMDLVHRKRQLANNLGFMSKICLLYTSDAADEVCRV